MPAENECHLPAATSRHICDSRHSRTAATAAQPPQPHSRHIHWQPPKRRSRQAAAISDNTRNLPVMIEMKSKKGIRPCQLRVQLGGRSHCQEIKQGTRLVM